MADVHFPLLYVERLYLSVWQCVLVQAVNIDVDTVGVRARHVETVDATARTEVVLRGVGVEGVGGQVCLSCRQHKVLTRHDQVQKALFCTDGANANPSITNNLLLILSSII